MKLTLQKASRYVSKALNINQDEILACFSPANKEDLDDLIELRKNIFPNTPLWDDRKYLNWRYSFEGNAENKNKIWVFRNGGKIQACMGAEEVTLCINKKKVRAHKAMDLLVAPEVDGIGLGAWMTLVFMEQFPTLFATGSTKSSYSMISNLFHEMNHRKTYKLFIRVNQKLEKRLKNLLLSNILSMPINLATFAYQKIIHFEATNAYLVKTLHSVPEQVDLFIDKTYKANHIQRTKNYLDWRFARNPRRDFIILGLYQNNQLLGISFSIISDKTDGFIFDWVYDKTTDSSNEIARKLLLKTIKHLKKSKLNLISTSVFDDSSSTLFNKLGFIKRDYDQTFFAHTSVKEIEPYLYDNNLWYLTESDANTDLY